MSFFETTRGIRFLDASVPRAVKVMESIAAELKRYNDAKEEQEKEIMIYVLSCFYEDHSGYTESHTSVHTSAESAEKQCEHMMGEWGYDPDAEDNRDYFQYEIKPVQINPATCQKISPSEEGEKQ